MQSGFCFESVFSLENSTQWIAHGASRNPKHISPARQQSSDVLARDNACLPSASHYFLDDVIQRLRPLTESHPPCWPEGA